MQMTLWQAVQKVQNDFHAKPFKPSRWRRPDGHGIVRYRFVIHGQPPLQIEPARLPEYSRHSQAGTQGMGYDGFSQIGRVHRCRAALDACDQGELLIKKVVDCIVDL